MWENECCCVLKVCLFWRLNDSGLKRVVKCVIRGISNCPPKMFSPPADSPHQTTEEVLALHHHHHRHHHKRKDTGVGSDAFPLDEIEFGPLLTFPAVAVDNCTRAPVEPAVGSVS